MEIVVSQKAVGQVNSLNSLASNPRASSLNSGAPCTNNSANSTSRDFQVLSVS